MLAALALTPVLLISQIWNTPQLDVVRDRPAIALGGGLVAALVVVVPLAVLFDRRPAILPLAALAALPFRIPIEAGGQTANLLVPLYLVIAAGALAWAVPRVRDPEAFDPPRANGALEWLLAGSVVLYAVQSSYSRSVDIALEQTVFFYVPFALLFALLREVEWSPRRLRAGLLVLVGARARLRRRRLRGVRDALAAAQPEGDRLQRARGVLPGQLALLRPEHLRPLPLAGDARARRACCSGSGGRATCGSRPLVLAVLWGGLVLTLSQSSFAGLLAGLFVLAALRFPVRRVAAAAARGGRSSGSSSCSPSRPRCGSTSATRSRSTTRPRAATS